ncbi:MAG TPA: glycosyltransferase family 1 protein [Armatimonadota bacterium]
MRVSVDGTHYVPGPGGGLVTIFNNLIRHLALLPDTETALLLREGVPAEHTLGLPEGAALPAGLTVVRVRAPRGALGRARNILARCALPSLAAVTHAARESRPDVIYVPLHTFDSAQHQAPTVFTIHDLQHEFLPGYFSRKERMRRSTYFRLMQRHGAAVVVPSEFVKGTLVERMGFAPERVRVVPWGLGPGYARVADEARLAEARVRYRLPERFVYFPAKPWPHKNHELLLKLLARPGCRECELVLSGFAPEAEGAELLRRAEELGVRGRVYCLGHLDYGDLPLIYSLATLVANPSRFEGFGLPVLEAMACGCPVLCSDATSLPEVAGDAACLAPADDLQAWEEALSRLWSDEGERERLAAAGVTRAAGFTWSGAAGRLRQVLCDAADMASGREC